MKKKKKKKKNKKKRTKEKKKTIDRSVLKCDIDHDHDNVDYECFVVIKYFLWTHAYT